MEERELPLPSTKKKNESHLDERGWERYKLLNPLLITLACCLMMVRKLHRFICKMDLKFAVLRKILLIIMTSFYKKVKDSQ